MKGRADVLNVTKNFLNPTTKPSVLTPSSASFTDTSLKVADAAGDTQLQVLFQPLLVCLMYVQVLCMSGSCYYEKIIS